ncbi:MAG: plasmid stabilization protein [Labilithrix sp.]|nr:plasmid stabilization protein [Labilithrix sp.]
MASKRGSKKAYTNKQKRQAEHIEESYEEKGVSKKTAAARAYATVNKQDGGGKKSGSGRKKKSASKKKSGGAKKKSGAKKRTSKK